MASSALSASPIESSKHQQQAPGSTVAATSSSSINCSGTASQQQSPRNTASMSSPSSVVSTATFVQLGSVEISKTMQDGEKFIKWDEDPINITAVTMRVDAKGFYLVWVDQNNEMDLLDIATIRDVRTAQYAKKPRDSKLRKMATLGSQDTLEEKTVTVCYGSDFVNVQFINFCCTSKKIAQHWTEELMRLAYNLTQLNGSATMFLQKAHQKLCLQLDKAGKIPVKNIIKQFAVSKDDRRRVEKALDVSGLPSGKGDVLTLSKFQFEDFFNLYKNLTQRTEVEKIFDDLVGTSKRRLMSTSQLVDFLNKTQRDPRLNEILYPYANTARARDLIHEYEPNKFNAQKGQLSFDGFLRYLMSEDNPIMAPNKLDLCDEMDQPLSHYFINSSHNTYLTGHQLTGKSSVEIYRQSLLAGCRCVELDFWNGRTEEPVIVHGYTFVPEIYAKDVLEAIAESAFKTSEFPVILSFENHCNPRQQAKIANYCRDIFGDMLLDKPIDTHPLEPSVELPPPALLKRKIIIKNKKKHHHHHHKKGSGTATTSTSSNSTGTPNNTAAAVTAAIVASNNATDYNSNILVNVQDDGATATVSIVTTAPSPTASIPTGNGDVPHHAPPLQQIRQNSKESTGSSDTDSSSDDESIPGATMGVPGSVEPDKAAQQKETEAGAEISALVNYVQPVHFSSFENSEKKNRFYEMSSFDEKQATTLLKERPIEFVNYNKIQLSRVYPAGTRFDSSNFMPQLFWNAGCQLVALNYQTLDLGMQLNLGIFEYNHRCGYLLKPEFMRRKDRRLDPFAESTVDGIIAGTVSITVLSGQFLTDKKVGTYVEVDMYGLPADTVRKKFRTKIVRDNSINPVFDEEPFVFKKVVLPELASMRIAAYEEGGKFIGHRVLPVIGLCPGYRHLALRTELGQPLPLSTLFLCIIVKDYVPDGLSDFAEALANPIKYQSELEKRAVQLSVLTEDMEPSADDDNTNSSSTLRKDLRPLDVSSGSPKRISVATVPSVDAPTENDHVDYHHHSKNYSQHGTMGSSTLTQQQSIEQAALLSKAQDAAAAIALAYDIVAEPLEKILENKIVREKRAEMEKKLESLRKKHEKEKIRVTSQKSGDLTDGIKKSKFYMGNKLVKRLSSKNIDVTTQIPPCPTDLGECSETDGALASGDSDKPSITRSQSERLLNVCRDYTGAYKDIHEKYHEIIYCSADKYLRSSQASQMKQLKALLEKETSDVMRQLQLARRNEVKALAQKHRDRDELVRMKREVASSLVERGVAERVRLTQAYEKRCEELEKQHELVRQSLSEHRAKAKSILERESESHACISNESDGYLALFHTHSLHQTTTTTSTSSTNISTNALIGTSDSCTASTTVNNAATPQLTATTSVSALLEL